MHNSKLIRSGILLLNETGVKINLVADYEQLAVLSGFQQRIERIDRGTVLISFDSGTGNTVRYTLRPGTFQFKLIDGALDLVQMKFGVTIDNEKNKVPFQYIVQGKYASVAAGHSETHASDFPIVICFDRGNGQATKQVRHLKSNGRLLLAVNASDHFWDLFDADAVGSNRTLPAASPIAGGEANYVPAF